MKRFGAHYLYINPHLQLKNGVIEIDQSGLIENYFSLNNAFVESTNTEFYTGILAPGITTGINLKDRLTANSVYVDVANENHFPPIQKDQHYIFNLQHKELAEIKLLLLKIQLSLPSLTIFDIINGCSYFPEKLLTGNAGIQKGKRSDIWLFENVDLIHKKILPETNIRIME